MSRKTTIYVQVGLSLLMIGWLAAGAFASYVVGPASQPGWLVYSLGVLGFALCAALMEAHMARYAHDIQVRSAQSIVEAWPHLIAMLEDLERISPERAEMIEVVKLELADHVDYSRRVAAGRPPGLREMLKRRKDES